MKSSQFFKFYIRFYKKKEKNTHKAVNEQKKNWEKLDFLLFNKLFYEAFENGN